MFGALQHLLHPTNCYALCAVARSGAHLLSAGLRATQLAGRPLQYFHTSSRRNMPRATASMLPSASPITCAGS
ncbi:MAG: Stf0 family sulfotransferase [Chthoniobacterales bacterium]